MRSLSLVRAPEKQGTLHRFKQHTAYASNTHMFVWDPAAACILELLQARFQTTDSQLVLPGIHQGQPARSGGQCNNKKDHDKPLVNHLSLQIHSAGSILVVSSGCRLATERKCRRDPNHSYTHRRTSISTSPPCLAPFWPHVPVITYA